MSKQILNNGDTMGVIRGKINDNFTETYNQALPTVSSVTVSQAVTKADNGKVFSNYGATTDVALTFAPVADLKEDGPFGVKIINEVGASDEASGGTVYHDNGYIIHVFTGSDTFVASSNLIAEVLVVAGGGGGAGGKYSGGGGGAGGLLYSAALEITAGSHGVTIGNGGAGGVGQGVSGTNGQSSVFATLTAVGGGGGGSRVTSPGDGGSGGGTGGGTSNTPGANTAGQGYPGVTCGTNSGVGGGGGGAGGLGSNTSAGGVTPTNGGIGLQFTQFATYGGSPAGWFAGGGGGGAYANGGSALSQVVNGGGGRGSTGNGENGTANTGGGGGGAERLETFTGGTGGSGIVIVRYQNNLSSRITLVPASGERLPLTTAVNRNLKSSVKGDLLSVRTTDSDSLVADAVIPAAANWVDTAQS